MKLFRLSSLAVLAACLSSTILTGCMNELPSIREESAKRVAMPVFMIPRDIPANPFMLQSYERVYKKYDPATIYIEGDGLAYTSPTKISGDPTPEDPVALRLAAQDNAPNVIYLARPGQYNKGWQHGKQTPSMYWGNKRFSADVIESYNVALDNIKAYYNIPSFKLVGYDGGAAVAAILAAKRKDILSLQTVAGDLDTKTYVAENGLVPFTGSLNPVDFAPSLVTLPQRHFIGKLDPITPPSIYNSFAQAAGNGQCMNVTLVDNADHARGWVEQWKVLKDMPLDCGQSAEPKPVPFDPTPLDGDKYKIKKSGHHKAPKGH